MAEIEEKVVGEPEVTPNPEATPEITPTEAPEEAPVQPGKSLEELQRELEAAQSHIGKLGTEVGGLRQYKTLAEQLLQERQRGNQAVPATPEKPIEFDYEHPMQSIEQIVNHRLEQERAQRQQIEGRRTVMETQQRFERGKAAAFKSDAKLYKGIEEEVANVVKQSVISGIVQPWEVDDPRTWKTAATVLAASREDYSRLIPDKVHPVSPTHTETPSLGRSASSGDDIEITLEESDRVWAKEQNYTEDEAKEIIKKEYLKKKREL